jgi:hypothetical protein
MAGKGGAYSAAPLFRVGLYTLDGFGLIQRNPNNPKNI